MGYSKDLTGQRFGRLVAIRTVESTRRGMSWECQCDCGNTHVTGVTSLTRAQTRSCGCLKREVGAATCRARTKHGHLTNFSRSRTYESFLNAKKRCNYPSHSRYSDYGGRGIQFLFTSFEHFFAELGERPDGKSLDRIDNDGHYSPGNCKWSTPSEQQLNKRKKV